MRKSNFIKKAPLIITIIGVFTGVGIAISVFLLGESDILTIVVKGYVFSIPLWIILIQVIKKKAKEL